MRDTSHVQRSELKARVEARQRNTVGEKSAVRRWKYIVVTDNSIKTLLEKIRIMGINHEIRGVEYFIRLDSPLYKSDKVTILVDGKLVSRKPKSVQVGNFVCTTVRYNNKDYRLKELDGSEYLHGDKHGFTGCRRIYTVGVEL